MFLKDQNYVEAISFLCPFRELELPIRNVVLHIEGRHFVAWSHTMTVLVEHGVEGLNRLQMLQVIIRIRFSQFSDLSRSFSGNQLRRISLILVGLYSYFVVSSSTT